MIALEVDVVSAEALRVLKKSETRISFAIANAINHAAKAGQRAVRKRVHSKFHVRKTQFIERQAAIIGPFASATKRDYFARVRVGEPKRLLLSKFQSGGERGPFTPGAKNVAIPVVGGARPTDSAPVKPELYVKALMLKPRRGKTAEHRGGHTSITGEQNTYLVPNAGIYQRPEGAKHARLLYALRPSVRLDTRLDFYTTMLHAVQADFRTALLDEVSKTLAFNIGR